MREETAKHVHLMIDSVYTRKFVETINKTRNRTDHLFIFYELPGTRFTPSRQRNVVHTQLGLNEMLGFTPSCASVKKILLKTSHVFAFIQMMIPAKLGYKIRTLASPEQKYIDPFLRHARYVFIHYLTDELVCLLDGFNKKKTRLVWIVWGGDLYEHAPVSLYDAETRLLLSRVHPLNIFQRFQRWIFNGREMLRRRVISRIDHVISNDYHLVKRFFKTRATWIKDFVYPNPVCFPSTLDQSGSLPEEYDFKKKFRKIVQVGNSADPSNNHVDVLKMLSRLARLADVAVVCPLSYAGNACYVDAVCQIGKQLFNENFIPLLQFLSPTVYFEILSQVDVVIMNHNRQQGYGNIRVFFQLARKIYMKKNSLYFLLKQKGFKVFPIDELKADIENDTLFHVPEGIAENALLAERLFNPLHVESLLEQVFSRLE